MKNAWLVRPFPHGTSRIKEFKDQKIVAIGWPNTGDLAGKSRGELKELLSEPPYSLGGMELGNAYATIDIFVNQMREGDIVLIPDGDDIYFAEITGGYFLDPSADDAGYSHRRRIRWLANTSRKCLSKALRSSLKVHRTTANLSRHSAEIITLASGDPFPAASLPNDAPIEVTYPLRPDFSITFKIPPDLSKEEAERVSVYFRSLYFN